MPSADPAPPPPETIGSLRERIFFMRQRKVGKWGIPRYWIQVHEAHKEHVGQLNAWMPLVSSFVGGIGIVGFVLSLFGVGFISKIQAGVSVAVFLISVVLGHTNFRYFRSTKTHAGSSMRADAQVNKDTSIKSSAGSHAAAHTEVVNSEDRDDDNGSDNS